MKLLLTLLLAATISMTASASADPDGNTVIYVKNDTNNYIDVESFVSPSTMHWGLLKPHYERPVVASKLSNESNYLIYITVDVRNGKSERPADTICSVTKMFASEQPAPPKYIRVHYDGKTCTLDPE